MVCGTKRRHGNGGDPILIVTCMGGGTLVDWVSTLLFLWLRIRSIRLSLLAGAFARARPLIGPPSFGHFIIYAFVAPFNTVLAIWAGRVAANLA